MLLEICYFIQARTSYVVDTNLFVNQFLQESPDRCAAALNVVGGEVNYFITDYIQSTVQFVTRDYDWKISRDDANAIRDLFSAMCHVNLPQYESDTPLYLISSHPVGDAVFIGDDDKNRKQHSINIMFHIRNQ
jgi:hypothetical protein